MNTVVIIKYFKYRHQNRLTLIKVLQEYNPKLGLRAAKETMERMLEGEPIVIEIEKVKLNKFIAILNELNLEFETK